MSWIQGVSLALVLFYNQQALSQLITPSEATPSYCLKNAEELRFVTDKKIQGHFVGSRPDAFPAQPANLYLPDGSGIIPHPYGHSFPKDLESITAIIGEGRVFLAEAKGDQPLKVRIPTPVTFRLPKNDSFSAFSQIRVFSVQGSLSLEQIHPDNNLEEAFFEQIIVQDPFKPHDRPFGTIQYYDENGVEHEQGSPASVHYTYDFTIDQGYMVFPVSRSPAYPITASTGASYLCNQIVIQPSKAETRVFKIHYPASSLHFVKDDFIMASFNSSTLSQPMNDVEIVNMPFYLIVRRPSRDSRKGK